MKYPVLNQTIPKKRNNMMKIKRMIIKSVREKCAITVYSEKPNTPDNIPQIIPPRTQLLADGKYLVISAAI